MRTGITQELCKDNSLAFLDCLIHVNSDGTLSQVYRKPTHTYHYLQFGSHHPLIHKLGVIRTLHYRAETIVSENNQISKEKDHIKKSFKNCSYPDWAFFKANKKKGQQQQKTGVVKSIIKSKRGLRFHTFLICLNALTGEEWVHCLFLFPKHHRGPEFRCLPTYQRDWTFIQHQGCNHLG